MVVEGLKPSSVYIFQVIKKRIMIIIAVVL